MRCTSLMLFIAWAVRVSRIYHVQSRPKKTFLWITTWTNTQKSRDALSNQKEIEHFSCYWITLIELWSLSLNKALWASIEQALKTRLSVRWASRLMAWFNRLQLLLSLPFIKSAWPGNSNQSSTQLASIHFVWGPLPLWRKAEYSDKIWICVKRSENEKATRSMLLFFFRKEALFVG